MRAGKPLRGETAMVERLPAVCPMMRSELSYRMVFSRAAAALYVVMVLAALTTLAHAEALEWNGFGTAGAELFINRLDGRVGFERQQGGTGTLNDLQEDLGLPSQTLTLGLKVAVRPLEHHLLRMYGIIPETYKGQKILSRPLTTKNNIYPAGTVVNSEARIAMFGFGYDLDFLVGPRWYGGLHGDLRYLDFRVRLGTAATLLEDTALLNEVTPCVGAHVQTRIPVMDRRFPTLGVGIFGRMTYGMTPNFLNYYDVSTGVVMGMAAAGFPALEVKLGYGLEGAQQQNIEGKDLEYQRSGFLVSLQVAY